MVHELFMREALEEAKKAIEWGEVPIGAVVVRNGQVIARGHNMRETWKDPTAHAEIIALREASRVLGGWRLTGCHLYVTLEPCPMCAGAILLSRVDEVIFGASEPKFGAAGSIVNLIEMEQFNHHPQLTSGILKDECGMILKEFFRERRG